MTILRIDYQQNDEQRGAAPAQVSERRPDWAHVRRCYAAALRYSCTSGKVHNALGVVHSYGRGEEMGMAYCYARSLAARQPFNSADNLRTLLRRVCAKTELGIDTSRSTSVTEVCRSKVWIG